MTGWREALTTARDLARTWGLRGAARRAAHEVQRHAGLLARLQPVPAPPSGFSPLPVDVAAARSVADAHPDSRRATLAAADRMLAGRYPYFSMTEHDVGWPPPWHRDPRGGEEWDATAPWTAFDAPPTDIKWIWEPSRFAFAWLLPRAHAFSGDRRHADETWRALASWIDANPAYRGANWYCGQESALRMFAVLFAVSALHAAGDDGAPHRTRVDQLLYDTGRRIELTLGHALSQRNNHALSEAVGLWVLGVTCPAWSEAARWRAAGAAALAEAIADQFAEDGAYIQESVNYHRLALHVLLVARWVSRAHVVALPPEVEPALARSYELLRRLRPPAGGVLPNYGHNDGALLLQLSSAPFPDLRPTFDLLACELGEPAPDGDGPWREPAAWLGLAANRRPAAPADHASSGLSSSGYLTARRGAWMVLSRVAEHAHHRPGHADALHVDVWRGDRNVALDPGSFAYSDPPPWTNALADTRVHNTASVGDRGQMKRRGRFLWTQWSRARRVEHVEDARRVAWLARVDATWDHSHAHWRLVRVDDDGVVVLDLVEGAAVDALRVHWNLDGVAWRRDGDAWADGELRVTLRASVPAEASAWCGDPASVLGWTSRSYGARAPCTAIELACVAARAAFMTTFTRDGAAAPSAPEEAFAAWARGARAHAWQLLTERT